MKADPPQKNRRIPGIDNVQREAGRCFRKNFSEKFNIQDAYFSSRSGSLRSSQSHTVYTFLDATPFDFLKVMQMSYDILGEDIGRLCKMQHFNTFHAF